MSTDRSRALFEQAQQWIPGGVNSPVRAFRAVQGTPRFMARGEGAYLQDADGNRYLDCVGSWGPLLFGHNHPFIRQAIMAQLEQGTTFGAPTEQEVELARAICRAVPSCSQVRLVCSGTEAAMSAIRLARGFTGRAKVVKFEGCYHGHADCLLAKAGSGVATFGLPDSAGVPPNLTADTITLPYNDPDSLRRLFAQQGEEVACVIVEPVAGNMGCVPPAPGFLEETRAVSQQYGALLIFDEVMTGFRLALGGAQELYGISPDLTLFGKVIGGGLPLAAYGGRRDIMALVAPEGPVYQAGTLAGNPVAVAAGLAALRLIEENPSLYAQLKTRGEQAARALREAALDAGVAATVQQVGSMLTLFFTDRPVTDYTTAQLCDTHRFALWFHGMLAQGVYWPPSQFESAFLSHAMTDADIYLLAQAARKALEEITKAA
jgi:glutamate-1-semialdehyde 2,1-aminomutase